jgi:hypothetical protein
VLLEGKRTCCGLPKFCQIPVVHPELGPKIKTRWTLLVGTVWDYEAGVETADDLLKIGETTDNSCSTCIGLNCNEQIIETLEICILCTVRMKTVVVE